MMNAQRRSAIRVGIAVMLTAGVAAAGAAPASADEHKPRAPHAGASFDEVAQQMLERDGIEAVVPDANGDLVVYSTSGFAGFDEHTQALLGTYSNVTVAEIDAPFTVQASTEVVGGIGYSAIEVGQPGTGNCTIGFAAWTPTGEPAMISAGHCSKNGARRTATLPSGEPLGELGFSQFGGPGNTPGTYGDPGMTDMSFWNISNPNVVLRPEVTDWTAPDAPASSATPITAVGEATLGPIEKSGRTTGRTPGVVVGTNGWASVGGRMVYGFLVSMESKGGDSGSPMHQDGTAVGIATSISTVNGAPHTWAADLQTGLGLSGGYTVALAVDAPVRRSPLEVDAGDDVSGTGIAGASLVVVPDGEAPFEADIDAEGAWSFAAPVAPGVHEYSAHVRSGFDRSDFTRFQVRVRPAAPEIVRPTEGDDVRKELAEISGLGDAGATVELAGAVTGTTVVADDGTWTWETGLGVGEYEVRVTQSVAGVTSAPRAVSFVVAAPAAPDPGAGGESADDGTPSTAPPASDVPLIAAGRGADRLAATGGGTGAASLAAGVVLAASGVALVVSSRRERGRIWS